MAMTPDPRRTPDHQAEAGDSRTEPDLTVLDDAAAALRSYTDQSWAGASQRILDHVLTATRRSRPVRGRAATGPFHVSDQVLTAYLRAAVDDLDDAELTSVRLDLDDDRLRAVTLGITVRYPEPIHPIAARVRATAMEALRAVLGSAEPLSPPHLTIEVTGIEPPPGLR
ncbi:hypothetical protein [Jiangella alkaliphila]|uniref:Asp23 family, cell envelope-related function n=1 Tax=Jiangella alkaliphila TaxID=419479 RepID=A0A1H2L8S6_9ACTN|nr:hypothetical protein [Jiangella alkaliphila]SDU76866.1 hypothetical protein SAMN04488563_5342 [Jiangella alkaliphila]